MQGFNPSRYHKAALQARKDMGSVIATPHAVSDFWFDLWDVSRARVFSGEQEKLNIKLTQESN